MTNTIEKLANDYVEVWNERDSTVRRGRIEGLWAEDAVEYTESNSYRGHAELQRRITDAHEEFVRGAGNRFRSAGDVVGHHGTVNFTVQMVPAGGGDAVWTGFIVLTLDSSGRIRTEHQYANPPRAQETTATRNVVKELLRRLATGNHERTAELFAPRIDWRLSWPSGDNPPWIRDRTTRAGIADHFRLLAESLIPEGDGFTVAGILADGPHAVVTGRSRQRVKATGKSFDMMIALHVTIEGGLITHYHVYEDSLAVARAALP
jgi:ketosteroid isomerase-like protein